MEKELKIMNYRSEIIKLINQIEDENVLNYILIIISDILKEL